MNKMNKWEIMEEEPESTFEGDDFERWWLAGMTASDKVTKKNQRELFENCIYLARSENSRMSQTATELRTAIADWAEVWNRRAGKS